MRKQVYVRGLLMRYWPSYLKCGGWTSSISIIRGLSEKCRISGLRPDLNQSASKQALQVTGYTRGRFEKLDAWVSYPGMPIQLNQGVAWPLGCLESFSGNSKEHPSLRIAGIV